MLCNKFLFHSLAFLQYFSIICCRFWLFIFSKYLFAINQLSTKTYSRSSSTGSKYLLFFSTTLFDFSDFDDFSACIIHPAVCDVIFFRDLSRFKWSFKQVLSGLGHHHLWLMSPTPVMDPSLPDLATASTHYSTILNTNLNQSQPFPALTCLNKNP